MKRLCFLSPDVEQTRKAVASLRRAGVAESNLLLIARPDIPLDNLPTAGIEKTKTDALPGFARGLAAGGAIGAVAGLVVMSIEEFAALGGAAIPLFALFGAGVSGLAGILAGASVPNSRLARFEHAIEQEKKILLMVDVEDDRMEEIKALLKTETPEVEFAGTQPHAPAIPS